MDRGGSDGGDGQARRTQAGQTTQLDATDVEVKSSTPCTKVRTGTRSWTDVEEVVAELHLRADRAEALAAGADSRQFTGREYRRRWSQLGRPGAGDGVSETT